MSTIRNTRTNRRLAITLAAALGLGALGLTAPAGAEIGDITSCTDPTHGGSACEGDDTPFDGPGDFLPGGDGPDVDPDPDPELPEGQPEADDDDLPPADVDGTVVADPNFTG